MLNLRRRLPEYALFSLIISAALVWATVSYLQNRNYLMVAFLDVGQGDAIFIETPQGHQILIDGGPNKKVLSELSKVMPFYDRSIDALTLTHPHQDHVGGLIEVLKRYDVNYVFDSDSFYDSGGYKEWTNLLENNKARHLAVSRGMKIRLSENASFEFLLPEAGVSCQKNDIHNCMVVSRLVHGDNCFLFTGDMERNLEFKILGADINCEVLKTGHHGSKTSTSDAFLSAVSPESAIIQSGQDNRYGHPHDIILKKLQSAGIVTLRNDELGTIKFYSDGSRIWLDGGTF